MKSHLLSARTGTAINHTERIGMALAGGTSGLVRKTDITPVASVPCEDHKKGNMDMGDQ